MRKLLTFTALGFAAWLAVCVAWAVTSRVTGIPGPARAAHASIDAAAGAIESVDLPRPLSVPRRAVARQMRASGRAIVRLYAVPERLASRLVGGADPHRGSGWVRMELCAAPARAPDGEIEAEIEREIRARVERVRVPDDRVRARLESGLERLEEARRRLETRAIVLRVES